MVYSCGVEILVFPIHSNDFMEKPEAISEIGVTLKIRVTLFFSHAKIISSLIWNISSIE